MKKKRPAKSEPEKISDKISHEDFLIVGIGASAGGIQALKVFFENVPGDSGMAYVVILHLSPDYDSQLAEVLRSVTQIPVTQVKEKILVAPNQVYVVPPNKSLSMAGGHIIVSPIHTIEERRAPVDIFFRTLAESHRERAVAVVLSGTGANGSMGLKRVKENGGAAFVQNPREAEYSEMPRNSIATDLIDQVLNVAEIPPKLVAYKNSRGTFQIAAEPELNAEQHQNKTLVEIFALLRERTGHDFSNYKRATILRRIERRINVHNLSGLSEYVALIRKNAGETQSLLKDLLISVTNFFRDKDAFGFLENDVLPQILEGKTPDDQIRVWVAGCATGEEAYSLAMLLAEKNLSAPQVQIFASDIDEDAVAHSREGFYTLNGAADVSPERLRRFFTKDADGFRVRRELREMVLFANHNLIKDPPFSRLDLVTCRNLLIYLNHSAQKRVMETFHFALRPGKFLFLGNSESIDGAGDLYASVSKEHHIFQSRHTARQSGYPVPESWLPPLRLIGQIQDEISSSEPETLSPKRISFGDLHLQLLEEYTPSIVVNEELEIVHLSENALPYLQMKGGEPTQNLLKLIHPDLRLELRTAFYQATQRQTNVEVMNVNLKIAGREEFVNIYVRPVLRQTNPARGFMLVLFERGREDVINAETAVYSSDDTVAGQLEEELVRSKTQLRKSAEQYEIQAEELKASNEELQAMNEELRSTAEEMETGKEELQSLNEELHTVNQELKIKIEEVSQSSNYLNNLINSTDIGTIFLDRTFRVRLFTPAALKIFNLIAADIGRPLADIVNRLENVDIISSAQTVLENLQTTESEVQTADGHKFLLRVLPYRTKEDNISGVVLTFYDINELKRMEEAKFHLAAIVESSEDSMISINFDGNITSWNYAAEKLYGYTAHEAIGKPLTMLTLPEDLVQILSNSKKIERGEEVIIFDTIRLNKDGRELNLEIVLSPVKNSAGKIIGVSTVARDITERRLAEETIAADLKDTHTLHTLSQRITSEENVQTLYDEILAAAIELTRADAGTVQIFDESTSELVLLAARGFKLKMTRYFERVGAGGNTPCGIALKNGKRAFVDFDDAKQSDADGSLKMHTEAGYYSAQSTPLITLSGRKIGMFSTHWREPNHRPTERELRFLDLLARQVADLLDRRQAKLKIEKSEEKYRTLFESIDEGFCTIEVLFDQAGKVFDYRFLDVNPSFGKQTGIKNAAGKTIREIVPNLEKHWFEIYGKIALTGESVRFENHAAELHSWYDVFAFRIGNTADHKIGVLFNDITTRKQTEENLLQSEERLRLMIEGAEDYAIFTMTLDSIIDSWNTGAEKVFGWTESEAIGQSCEIIFTPEDRAQGAAEKEMKTALSTGRAPDERFHLRKDGSRFYVSGVMMLLKNKSGKAQGFVKIARDMSERIVAEKALRDKEMLQRLVAAQEEERKRVARDLHDELGQQLTALRLKLDAAQKMCDDDDMCAKIDEIEQIARSIDNGVDFLAWELRPAALDQFGLIAALSNYVRQWSHYSGVSAELLASSVKKTRFAPEIETNLYRIVQEALNNIHKHARAKSVEVMLEKRDDLLILIIGDDGRGFNPNDKKKYQKGIGLIGMRERTALVKGTFEIESAIGEGTTVFVRVPVGSRKNGGSDYE